MRREHRYCGHAGLGAAADLTGVAIDVGRDIRTDRILLARWSARAAPESSAAAKAEGKRCGLSAAEFAQKAWGTE